MTLMQPRGVRIPIQQSRTLCHTELMLKMSSTNPTGVPAGRREVVFAGQFRARLADRTRGVQ